VDNQELMIRAAWLYHVEGLTQAQIAERMNVTRRRVNEVLAMAVEEGVVRVSFSSPLAENVRLEEELCRRFELEEAVVVPTPEDERQLHAVLGRGAAAFLDRIVRQRRPASIGVGWGDTLRETVRHMTPADASQIELRSMMGGLTRGAEINTFEIVRSFAQVLGAKCRYFAAPIYADSEASREVIVAQPVFQEFLQDSSEVDISFLSVGDVTGHSLQVRYGLPPGTDIKALIAAGAVGDLLGRYLDPCGLPVDHPLNRQVISPDLENYRRIPCRIIASGGPHKHAILLAAVRAGLATTLVTDSRSARTLLAAP
jgi:DNA-binding transcriptional regulator LsrR (DeoR family)